MNPSRRRYLCFMFVIGCPGVGLTQAMVMKNIDSLLLVLKRVEDDTSRVIMFNELSNELIRAAEFEKSRQYADSAIWLADRIPYLAGKANAYNHLGQISAALGNYQGALEYFYRYLKISEEIGDKRGIGVSYVRIGAILDAQGNYTEAMKKYVSALRLYEEVGSKQGIGSCYGNISNVYNDLGKYPEALEHRFTALAIYKEIGYVDGIGTSYYSLGRIYLNLGNYPVALENLLISLKIRKEIGAPREIAGAYHNIGLVHERQGNYAEALINYREALNIQEKLLDKLGIANSYNAIGTLYQRLANYPAALENSLAALRIREEIGDKQGIAQACISIGNILGEQATVENTQAAHPGFQEALDYLNRGLSLAKEIGAKEVMKAAYDGLRKVYKGLQDFETAVAYNSLFIAMKDSILSDEATRRIEQLRINYEVEKAVAEEKVRREKLLTEQRFENERILAERNALHQLALAEEAARKERAIAIEKLNYEFALAEEKSGQERTLAEMKFQSEKQLAEESARHELTLAQERAQVERERVEREKRAQIFLTAGIVIAIVSLFIFLLLRQRNLKRRAIEKAETAHKMAELELQSLRAQLNPHFMFNSLNAIQELILKEENDKSHTYLARFARLLRMLLENANSPFIPLAREVEFLELYLSLERLRIPDLKYLLHIDPTIDCEQVRIPNMILQPYIENAIWHGLSHKKTGERKIDIRISSQPEGVKYEIEDNGVGRKKSAELKSQFRKEHKSKGMELLTRRFRLLTKEYRYQIDTQISDVLQNEQVAGTLVAIHVPWGLTREMRRAS